MPEKLENSAVATGLEKVSFHSNPTEEGQCQRIFKLPHNCTQTSLVVNRCRQMVKLLSTMQETWVQSVGQEDSLEKEMATHSSTLA